MLDREVGDAAAGIDVVRRGDGVGGAGVQAAGTLPAVVGFRLVGRDLEVGEDGAEEEPGAEPSMDLHGALPAPAKAGLVGEIALQDRTGIDVAALASADQVDVVPDLAQAGLHDVVVVVVPGIAGDAPWGLPLGRRDGTVARQVVQGEDDHGARPRHHLAGIAAAVRIAGEPGHLAVLPLGDPVAEDIGVRRLVRAGNPAVIEPDLARDAAQVLAKGLGGFWTWNGQRRAGRCFGRLLYRVRSIEKPARISHRPSAAACKPASTQR